MAEQLAAGAVDHETFARVRSLLDAGWPPEQVLSEARKALERKELGVFRLSAGDALLRLGRRSEASEQYRKGLAVAED